MRVNNSEIEAWLRCRKSHFYSYVQNLRRRTDRPAMGLGTAVHIGIAAGLTGQDLEEAIIKWRAGIIGTWQDQERDGYKGLSEVEMSELADIVDKAFNIAHRALIHFRDNWEVVLNPLTNLPLVEWTFNVPTPWGEMFGTVDVVGRDDMGVWLIDHKVRKSFQTDEDEEANPQMARYQWALNKLGQGFPIIQGSVQNQIKAAVPSEPKRNQNGSMSRALIATTWDVYRAALVKAGLDPAEYQDMKEKCDSIEWFRPVRAYRNERELGVVASEMDSIVLSMRQAADTRREPFRILNSFNCRGCQHRELCFEEARGGDTEFVKRQLYLGPDGAQQPFLEPEFLDEETNG